MSDLAILLIMYAVGLLMLVAEIFIPSQGVLTIAGLGFLVAGVVKTFSYAGNQTGVVAIFACLVCVPAFAFLAIKYWPRTPIGRRIAPPNPIVTAADSSVPVEELSRLIGRTGRSATALRPVGICEFDGKRVSCIAEFGIVDADETVEAVRIEGSNLAVRPKKT